MSDTYYELVGEFDSYTGNFEREMTDWVFGVLAEWNDKSEFDRPHAQAFEDAGLGGLEMEPIIEGFPHDEYGLIFQTIGQQNENPSIIWHLMEDVTDEQWNLIRSAMEAYVEPKKAWHTQEPTSPKLLNLTLSKVETVRTKLR